MTRAVRSEYARQFRKGSRVSTGEQLPKIGTVLAVYPSTRGDYRCTCATILWDGPGDATDDARYHDTNIENLINLRDCRRALELRRVAREEA